nr:50S ribosomal protein L20 [Candidatus Nitrospira allomarina]
MPRVKGGPQTRQRRKKRLKLASGQYGGKSKLFRTATESVDKGQAYAYTGRKQRENVISGSSGLPGSAQLFARKESPIVSS